MLLVLSACEPLPQEAGQVVKVKDGDSVVLLDDRQEQVEIRLAHIDAPERGQAFGKESKKYLSDLVAGQSVTYSIYEPSDRYGRVVAVLYLPDGTVVNKKMVEAGYAWHFKKYSNSFEYGRLEKAARSARQGLWADQGDIVPPWDYRR